MIQPETLTGFITLTAIDDPVIDLAETVRVDIDTVSVVTEAGEQQVVATITDDDLPSANYSETSINPSAIGAAYDYLGYSVDISGDYAVVGAYGNDQDGGNSGAAYIFEKVQGSDTWTLIKTIRSSETVNFNSDEFGYAVAISGDTVVVGARSWYESTELGRLGCAFVFQKDTGGENNWGKVKKILAVDAGDGDHFGYSVDISGDTIVVGAPWDDQAGSNSGSAYVFTRNAGGVNNWGQAAKLMASDGTTDDEFGDSVTVDGDTIAIGVARKNSYIGAVYLYQKNQGGPGSWGQSKSIVPSDEPLSTTFGSSVSLADNVLAVGAPGVEVVYLFARDAGGDNNWGVLKKISPNIVGTTGFGKAVALSGFDLAVGAYYGNGATTNSGLAYLFRSNEGGAGNWGQVQTLFASGGMGEDYFGWSLGLSHGTVVVGAYRDDNPANDSGFVTFFTDLNRPPDVSLHLGMSQRFAENGGTLPVTANLSKTSDLDVTIDVTFSGNAQTTDYTASAQAFNIPAGSLSGNILLTGIDDDLGELDETVTISLGQMANGLPSKDQEVTAIIEDDDFSPSSTIFDFIKLLPPENTADAGAGYTVAVDGDWAVLGAPGYNSAKGAVFIFSRNEGGANHWGLSQAIIPNNSSQEMFGFSVDIAGDILVIGEPENYTSEIYNRHGSAYIYHFAAGNSNSWEWVRTLDPPGVPSGDFGDRVVVSDDTVIIGNSYAGSAGRFVYIFGRNAGGKDNYGLLKSLTAPAGSGTTHNGFRSFDLEGDILVVGDYSDDSFGTAAGAAFLFGRNQGGVNNWGEIQRLYASDAGAGRRFGKNVSVSGTTLAIGGYGNDVDTRTAYLFSRDQGGINNWGEIKRINLPDTPGDSFSETKVTLLNNLLFIGLPHPTVGEVLLFEQNTGGPGNWGQASQLGASDGAGEGFGVSLDVSTDTVIVGSTSDDDQGQNAGAAYVYSMNVQGDTNFDGRFDLADIITLLGVLSGENSKVRMSGDLNADSRLGLADILAMMSQLSEL